MLVNWLRTVAFTLLAPGGVCVLAPWLILRGNTTKLFEQPGALQWLGILLALIGICIYGWTVSDFVLIGEGTPAPVFPTRQLVVTGLYRYVRNPMYLGVLSVLIGESCCFESAWLLLYAGMVCTAFSLFVIYYEEPTLLRKYGSSYSKYCQRVRRWIPRLIPYHPNQASEK
jgi:protein-S-isoprenylcysteine O-methyltransferase Ste14